MALSTSCSYDPINPLNGTIELFCGETRESCLKKLTETRARSLEAHENVMFQLRVR